MNERRRAAIQERLSPDFADRLRAQGLARGIIWRDGFLPAGASSFAKELDQRLRHYAFSMLGAGIDAKIENERELSENCFAAAAEALEAVALDAGPDDPRRGYLSIIGAAAYSLARFNARAYTLTVSETLSNLSDIEEDFRLFIIRDFTGLRQRFRAVDNEEPTFAPDLDQNEYLESILVYGNSLNYRLALVSLLAYFISGSSDDISAARARLDSGIAATERYGLVSAYWLYRLTRLIVDDLGDSNYHVVLPQPRDPELAELRGRFIRRLAARHRAQIDLWPSQIEAAARCFDVSDNLVVSLPTSSGKTRVAELAMLPTLAAAKKVVYITPLRALCAQVERVLKDTFGPLGFEISASYMLSDSLETSLGFDISVFTPDRLDSVLRRHPEMLNDVGLIIFDEGHMIRDGRRELGYELLIDRVTRLSKRNGLRIVCLSALLPHGADFDNFVNWIRNDDELGGGIRSKWRPTRQRFGTVTVRDKAATYRVDRPPDQAVIEQFLLAKSIRSRRGPRLFPNKEWDWTIATAWRLLDRRQSVMIYCPRKSSTVAGARRIARLISAGVLTGFDNPLTAVENALLDEWLPAEDAVAICLRSGVVTLHADIPPQIKACMYRLLAEQKARIILSSPAIAQGVDVAVSAVIFHSLFKASNVIDRDEFWNVAGRAGRAFADVDGQIIFVTRGKYLDNWNRLIDDVSEAPFISGLFQVISRLLIAIHKKYGPLDDVSRDEIIERDVKFDNSAAQEQIDGIDHALLTLLEESDIAADEAVQRLDDLLRGSFLMRSLSSRSDAVQVLYKRVLTARIRKLTSYPLAQRRSAYLGSIPIRLTGPFEQLVDYLRPIIAVLEAKLSQPAKSRRDLVPVILDLVERILDFEEYQPQTAVTNSRQIIDFWLNGGELSKSPYGPKGAKFIENSLSYDVVRAIEAIRDPEVERPAVSVGALISRGTISVIALNLMQDGLRSRTAAHEIAAKFNSDIVSRAQLQRTILENQEMFREFLSTRSLIVFDDYVAKVKLRGRDIHEDVPGGRLIYPVSLLQPYSGYAWLYPDLSLFSVDMKELGVAMPRKRMHIPASGIVGAIHDDLFTAE